MATDRMPDMLRAVLAHQRADIHTTLPAAVVDYDPGTQTATIEIGLREILESLDDDDPDTVTAYPRLSGVPVAFPSAGSYHVTFPLPAGSTGALVCTEGDLSRWIETGQVSDPGVNDRHGLGGFFVPGLRHSRNRLPSRPDAFSIGIEGGITIRIDGSKAAISGNTEIAGTLAVDGTAFELAREDKIATEFLKIKTTLDSVVSATFGTPYVITPGSFGSSKITVGG